MNLHLRGMPDKATDLRGWGGETDYGTGMFSREDCAALARQLKSIQGRFLLSLNDRPKVRELFAGCQMEAVSVTYTVAGARGKMAAPELLIQGRSG